MHLPVVFYQSCSNGLSSPRRNRTILVRARVEPWKLWILIADAIHLCKDLHVHCGVWALALCQPVVSSCVFLAGLQYGGGGVTSPWHACQRMRDTHVMVVVLDPL